MGSTESHAGSPEGLIHLLLAWSEGSLPQDGFFAGRIGTRCLSRCLSICMVPHGPLQVKRHGKAIRPPLPHEANLLCLRISGPAHDGVNEKPKNEEGRTQPSQPSVNDRSKTFYTVLCMGGVLRLMPRVFLNCSPPLILRLALSLTRRDYY